MATVIQKAIIEVQYDDLEKAQLAMKKAGVEMVNFGAQANKAKGGTGGLTQSVGDLSEKLDKRLEKSLGRSFKATDRLQSILGQAGTVATVVTTVVGGLTMAAVAMYDALDQGQSALSDARAGLSDMADAADEAKAATSLMFEAYAAGQEMSLRRAVEIGKAQNLLMLQQAEAARIATKIRQADADDVTRWALTKNDAIGQATGRAFRAQYVAQLDLMEREAKDTLARISMLSQGEDWQGPFISDADLKASQARTEAAAKASAKKTASISRKSARETVNIFAEATDEIAYQWERLPDRFEVALRDWEPLTAWSDSFKPAIADLADALDQEIGGAFLNLAADMDKATASTKPFDDAVTRLTASLEASGQAALSSAYDAIVYGESFADQLNDFAEAQLKMAVISAAMEAAKGAAMTFINPAQASSHYAAAAAFGVAAALAGGVAAATGGLNGPTTTESSEEDQAPFTGAARTGPDRSEVEARETVINLNLAIGSRPLTRLETAQIGGELNSLRGAA